jgi:hypothetical protein
MVAAFYARLELPERFIAKQSTTNLLQNCRGSVQIYLNLQHFKNTLKIIILSLVSY